MTKFRNYWVKIVDFLNKSIFLGESGFIGTHCIQYYFVTGFITEFYNGVIVFPTTMKTSVINPVTGTGLTHVRYQH